jgi:hypothetical protein
MRTLKSIVIVAAVIVVAAISVGASGSGDSMPLGVAAERWIAIGDKAGFKLTSDSGASLVTAELYLRTDKGWRRARLDNPAAIVPLERR